MIKNILIISYHFYPSREVGAKRPSELAKKLSAEGYTISVIAARVNGDDKLIERLGNLVVTYIPVPPDILKKIAHARNKIKYGSISKDDRIEPDSNSQEYSHTGSESLYRRYKRRILSMFAITENLGIWALMVLAVVFRLRLKNKIDLVITSGPPMVVHNIGYLAKKIYSAKWIMDLRDPLAVLGLIYQSDLFLKPKVRSGVRKDIELLFERKWLACADLITTASPGIKNEILTRHQEVAGKIHVIYNGFDYFNPGPRQKSDSEKMTFIYAGSLYYNRDPFPLLEGLKSLSDSKLIEPGKIEFLFYGHCESWNGKSLAAWIEKNQMCEYIEIHPSVPADEINKIMCDSDVLINFCQGQPLQIPAKTFDYLGIGKTTLVITEQDSDTAILMKETGCGTVIDPEIDDPASALLDMYKNYWNGNNKVVNNLEKIRRYSREAQNARYLELIEGLG